MSLLTESVNDMRTRERMKNEMARLEAIASFVMSTYQVAADLKLVLDAMKNSAANHAPAMEAARYLGQAIEREFRVRFGRPMFDDEKGGAK